MDQTVRTPRLPLEHLVTRFLVRGPRRMVMGGVALLFISGSCSVLLAAKPDAAAPATRDEVAGITITDPSPAGGDDQPDEVAPVVDTDDTTDTGTVDEPANDGDDEPGPVDDPEGETDIVPVDEVLVLPDLVVTNLDQNGFTVTNEGTARAGAFTVAVADESFSFGGLAAGSSASVVFDGCVAGFLLAAADAGNRIEELDERNNVLVGGPFSCPAPDLVVTEVTRDSVTVSNEGNEASPPSAVSIGDVGLEVPALGILGSATLTFDCTEGTLTAVADAAGLVAESNEANNSLKAGPFTCPRPDLAIANVRNDSTVVINLGDAASGPFVVSVSSVGTFTVPGLAPGATDAVTYGCVPGLLTATADPLNDIDESDEGNNSASNQSSCPRPDLVISDLSGSGVTVTNSGDGASGSFVVELTTDSVQTFSVGSLAAGASIDIQFGGCIEELFVKVDADNAISESNESNNSEGGGFSCPGVVEFDPGILVEAVFDSAIFLDDDTGTSDDVNVVD